MTVSAHQQVDPAPARCAGDLRVTSVGAASIGLAARGCSARPRSGCCRRPVLARALPGRCLRRGRSRLSHGTGRAAMRGVPRPRMPGTARRDLHVKRHDGGSRLVLCSIFSSSPDTPIGGARSPRIGRPRDDADRLARLAADAEPAPAYGAVPDVSRSPQARVSCASTVWSRAAWSGRGRERRVPTPASRWGRRAR